MAKVEVVVQASGPWASMLVQMLREEGAEVDWTPPVEERGAFQELTLDVVSSIIATGAWKGIEAAVERFRQRAGGRASVTMREVDLPPRHAKPER
jgi:hypothetical protein